MSAHTSRGAPRNALAEAALRYAEQGYAVFPCKPRDKKPLLAAAEGGRGYLDATSDVATVAAWWQQYPDANIGLVPGKSGLVVVDVDGPKGEITAESLGLNQSGTRESTTGRGRHLWYLHPGGRIGNSKPGEGIDIRADAGYVLVPPSVHPSGAKYAWVDPSAEIQRLPVEIVSRLQKPIREGGRNNAVLSHLGAMRRKGADLHELLAAARAFNELHIDPPLDDAELERIAENAAKYPPVIEDEDAVVDELNRTYSVVQVGSKGRVMQELRGEVTIMHQEDFRFLHGNRMAGDPAKPRPIADVWLRSPRRRQYSGLVFEPGGTRTPGAFNLWRGWGVEAREGSANLFLTHLRDVVCSGDERLYRWVLAWFADIFRNPTRKPGTAIALRGRQGTGKTVVGKVFGHLLGRAYRNVASDRMVTGQFNQHLEACLLLHADEAFWAGAKAAEGVLKDLVTNDRQWIERKGIDPVEIANLIRLFVTSNNEWVVPAGLEERRFCVIDVSESRMQDSAYFAAIYAELESGGYEALLHLCLHADFTDVDLRIIPVTNALVEQKVASLSAELGWWLDLLRSGTLPGDTEGAGVVVRQQLYRDYLEHSKRIGARRRSIETQIGMFLRKYVPELRRFEQESASGRNVGYFEFPSLEECRAALTRLTPGLTDWDAPSEWVPNNPSASEESNDAI